MSLCLGACAVRDRQHHAVQTGTDAPPFVGPARGGSRDPLEASLFQVFRRNGVHVRDVSLEPSRADEVVRDARITLGEDRAVLLSVRERDVHMAVYDLSGKLLVAKQVQGTDNLKTVPRAYRSMVDELINSPEIRQALR
jgi:hypothetical protein